MKKKVNYKSVVVIGAFNPSILTPGFLVEYCSFKPGQEPVGQSTPVATEISFGNVRFIMELSKFQISVHEIDDFAGTFPLEVAGAYLTVLQHTPLSIAGLNLNYSLTDIDISRVCGKIRDPFGIGSVLHVKPTAVSVAASRQDSENLVVKELSFIQMLDDCVKNNIRISVGADSITINNNFEVSDLADNRAGFAILTDKYDSFVELDLKLIDRLADE